MAHETQDSERPGRRAIVTDTPMWHEASATRPHGRPQVPAWGCILGAKRVTAA